MPSATSCDLTEDWPEVLGVIADRLGNGTVGLLNGSTPKIMVGDTLTIELPATGRLQKQMCESNGRSDQIASVLSDHLGKPVRVKFAVAADAAPKPAGRTKPNAQKRSEILNDPAVKTILVGLDATVTGIEES